MLKVSSNNITFNQTETIKSLTLQNQFPNNIIFKIKVSAVGHLSIQPNKGFIRANSSVPFIIKSLQKQKFEVKVLFTYGFILNKNNQFSEEWDKIKQNAKFQHSIIIVKRTQSYRGNQKMAPLISEFSKLQKQQKAQQSRKKSPRVLSVQKKRSQRSIPKLNVQSTRKLSPRKDTEKYEEYSRQIFLEEQPEEDCPFYSTEEMQQLIEELHKSSKYLEVEKIKNIKLTQQLSISQAKLKEITQDKMHIETHKSIGIVCQDYHTTFTFLVIIGLACFVFGFFLGKIQAEIV